MKPAELAHLLERQRMLLRGIREFHDEMWMQIGPAEASRLRLLVGGCDHPDVQATPLTGKNAHCQICGYEVAH